MPNLSGAASDTNAPLDALYTAFSTQAIRLPEDGRVLFLRARAGGMLRALKRTGWVCEQSFKPFADELARSGLQVVDADRAPAADATPFALIVILPPRQREEARALYAHALGRLAPGGTLVASVPNAEGARSSEADLASLAGSVASLSKHKCRVFWTTPQPAGIDAALLQAWAALDAPQPIAGGRFVSRPGLFAWNRIDPASALLAAHLPSTLGGAMADLGAGYGFLAAHLIDNNAGLARLDLYEAEGRALGPARDNMQAALARRGSELAVSVHWHDVTTGLPARYDAIVSNPPFHLGRADRPELGRAFIDAAANALLPHGCLWLVANRHLPYEATLAARFAQVRCVVAADGFKVYEARSPQAAAPELRRI